MPELFQNNIWTFFGLVLSTVRKVADVDLLFVIGVPPLPTLDWKVLLGDLPEIQSRMT